MNQKHDKCVFFALPIVILLIFTTLGIHTPAKAAVSDLDATHRNGQTFITWTEDSAVDGYHIYRHHQVITPATLIDATRLTSRWGPLDQDTSKNPHKIPASVPSAYYVISDLGTPLSDSTGLFVYTSKPDDIGNAYYAVTTVSAGVEALAFSAANSLQTAVPETNATPTPILTHIFSNQDYPGADTYLYTQFMDYASWNPTFEGYAYLYAVALPASYDPEQQWALSLRLHAHGEEFRYAPGTEFALDYNVIELHPTDPKLTDNVNKPNSWWFGFAADHNYLTDGSTPTSGVVENFTEQRLLMAIDAVIANPLFSVDSNRIHAIGNSMGASGSLALALHYPNVFTGVYASQPMTDYPEDPIFENEFIKLWGTNKTHANNELPLRLSGPYSQPLQRFSVGTSNVVSAWDWMDHQKQMVQRRGDEFAFIAMAHGANDPKIQWATQGQPSEQSLYDATIGFTYEVDNSGHTWQGFDSVTKSLFGLGYAPNYAWRYPLNYSFPAITSDSRTCYADYRLTPTLPDGKTNDAYDPLLDCHNMYVEWKVPFGHYSLTFDAPEIVDQPGYYAISLRPRPAEPDSNYNSAPSPAYHPLSANITPRRTQLFAPAVGQTCHWTATRNTNAELLASGVVSTDDDGLVTAHGVPIEHPNGIFLEFDCTAGSAPQRTCDVNSLASGPIDPMTWTLLSVPCTLPQNTSVSDIFDDDINDPNAVYVLFTYDYTVGYLPLTPNDEAPEPGQAFWFIHTDANPITIDLPDGSAHPATQVAPPCTAPIAGCTQITAHKLSSQRVGWNLGGNPLPSNVAIDNLRITGNSSCEAASDCTLGAAATSQIIHDTFFSYNDGAYVPIQAGATILPWAAHWLTVLQNGDGAILHWPVEEPSP